MPEIFLPTLHKTQVDAFLLPGRFKVIRCGRRWGKTDLAKTIACDGAAKGRNIGWFAPEYKIQSEAFTEIADILDPVKKNSSKVDGLFRTTTGGRLDFWTLENERAGRSRKYHQVIIDEAAFTKPNMMKIWATAIKPTLLDFRGRALVLSTPNGVNDDNFFYNICTDPKYGFTEYHAPTRTNPYMPAEELVLLEQQNHPLVYRQEYLAEFVDWSGVAFFSLADLLVDDRPVPIPTICDAVYAVIDTAVKAGASHDSTAVSFWAQSKHIGHQLVCLDWDLIQIEGASLELWLPKVFSRLEELAVQCRARMGSLGAFIEDKASGSVLIQQANNHGWQAQAIEGTLTAVGKDERAIGASPHVYQKKVKISEPAYDKVVTVKGVTKNHLVSQVTSFRLGDKEAYKRADDALDTFVYAVLIAFGHGDGF